MGSAKRKNIKLRRSLKRLPCVACGTMGSDFNPIDPAHIRTFKVTQSDHPANITSLCRLCHNLQHREGWWGLMCAYPGVQEVLTQKGWDISENPFKRGSVILVHPEIP